MTVKADTNQNPMRLLMLAESIKTLAKLETSQPANPILHQYWDEDPPRQITTLLRHNQKMCRSLGVSHVVWDKSKARQFLSVHFPQYTDLFVAVPHPAMGSDLLRLCLLWVHGGFYLDADMALRNKGGERLPSLLHEVLLFKWSHPDRNNLPNWCFGFRAGHPMLEWMVNETAKNIEMQTKDDPQKALRNILSVSGPGLFTRLAGSWISENGCPPGFLLLNVEEAYKSVQNGPELLGAPLDYKSTKKHWLVASRK